MVPREREREIERRGETMGPFGVVHSPKNTAICAKCAKDRPPTPSFSNMSNLVTMAANWEPTWSQQGKLLRHLIFFSFRGGHCSFVCPYVCLSVGMLNVCCLFIYLSTCHPGSSFRKCIPQILINKSA